MGISSSKNLLCKKADYFDKMFNSIFREGIEQVAAFPEDDLDAWTLLVAWIYGGKPAIDFPGTVTKHALQVETPKYFKAIGLAEKYMIYYFADLLLDTILLSYKSVKLLSSNECLKLGYACTDKGSKLRLYLSRVVAYVVSRQGTELWRENMYVLGEEQPSIILDAFKTMVATTKDGMIIPTNPLDAPPCDYHQHDADTQCPYSSVSTVLSTTSPAK